MRHLCPESASAKGIPLTVLFLVVVIVVELGCGLLVLVGYKARWAAIALFLYLIPTTLIFHTNFSERLQVIQFMKNLAIMEGYLWRTIQALAPSVWTRRPYLRVLIDSDKFLGAGAIKLYVPGWNVMGRKPCVCGSLSGGCCAVQATCTYEHQ